MRKSKVCVVVPMLLVAVMVTTEKLKVVGVPEIGSATAEARVVLNQRPARRLGRVRPMVSPDCPGNGVAEWPTSLLTSNFLEPIQALAVRVRHGLIEYSATSGVQRWLHGMA